ncbi:zf-HC2 domain-containing protein [Acrocarpospora catenulata]|uniref:zf-HC2 domain-containing protein n=1 Tax=Acrocarpospora catenulata TaxID=2836182 RepID=UPI001BDA3C0F|nr:zf-HC2 domain-containing protein [Acrocarpospora catenulata]
MSVFGESAHHDVAAYALGVLDLEDVQGFELHLAACAQCRVELEELRELPGLLDEVKSESHRTRQ